MTKPITKPKRTRITAAYVKSPEGQANLLAHKLAFEAEEKARKAKYGTPAA
jgi:hypothetical protein